MYYSAPFEVHLLEHNTSSSHWMWFEEIWWMACSLKRLGWLYLGIRVYFLKHRLWCCELFSPNGYPLSSWRSEVHAVQLGWYLLYSTSKRSNILLWSILTKPPPPSPLLPPAASPPAVFLSEKANLRYSLCVFVRVYSNKLCPALF